MGPVAGGEEEAENLSTIDMLHDVVDSFAKQFSVRCERELESQQTGHKCVIVGV